MASAATKATEATEGLPAWFLRDVQDAIREAQADGRRWQGFRICPQCGKHSLRLRATRYTFAWDPDGCECDLLPDGAEASAYCLRCKWKWTRDELDDW